MPQQTGGTLVGDPEPPPIDPEAIALQAVTQLQIPKATPMIGPPPEINQLEAGLRR